MRGKGNERNGKERKGRENKAREEREKIYIASINEGMRREGKK